MVKKGDKAKLEEEEVGFSLHYGEPQGGGRALRVHQLMLGWSVGGIVSIDTLTRVHRLAFSPALCCPASRALERRSSPPHQPAIPRRYGWSPELSGDSDHQPLAVCTLVGSANERTGAQTRGQDVRLRRQAGRSWRRSKRQSAFYLQASHATHIAGREDTHPDELPPGSEGVCPPVHASP